MRVRVPSIVRKLLTTGAMAIVMWGGSAVTANAALAILNGGFESPTQTTFGSSTAGDLWEAHGVLGPHGSLLQMTEASWSTNGMVTGSQFAQAVRLDDNPGAFTMTDGTPSGLYIDQVIGTLTAADLSRTVTLSADLIRAQGEGCFTDWISSVGIFKDAGVTIGFLNAATGKVLASTPISYTDTLSAYDLGDVKITGTVSLTPSLMTGLSGTTIKAFVGFRLDGSSATADANSISVDNLLLSIAPSYPSLTWQGSGTPASQWSTSSGVLNWTDGNTNVAYLDSSNVTFDDSVGNGSTTVDLSVANVSPASVTFANTTEKTYTLQGSKAIVGNINLTKNNNGKVVILNDNSINGETLINSGTIQLGDGGTSGSLGTGPIVNEGTLSIKRSDTFVVPNKMSGAGTFTIEGTGIVKLTSTNDFSGNTVVNSGTLELAAGDGSTATILGTLTVNSGAVVKSSAPNTFGQAAHLDSLTINGGTVDQSSQSQSFWDLPVSMTGGSLILGTSSEWGGGSKTKITATSTSTGPVTISGSGHIGLREGLSNNSLTFDVADGPQAVDMSVSVNIQTHWANTNEKGITKTGEGTLLLSGVNTYEKETILTQGTLQVGSATAIPNGTYGENLSRGNVVFDDSANTATLDINGFDVSLNGLEQYSLTSTSKVVNNVSGTTKTLTIGMSGSDSTFNGIIANNTGGTGKIALKKTGTGTFSLGNFNTYTGSTTVSGGTLAADFNASYGKTTNNIIPATSTLILSNGTLAVLGDGNAARSQTVNGLTLSANTANRVVASNDYGGTVTVNLGAITRGPSSSIDFTLPLYGTIKTTSGTASQIFRDAATGGAYATVNGGLDWAVKNSSSGIVPCSTYVNNTWASANNTNVTMNSTQTNATTGTLRFGSNLAGLGYTVTLSGTCTVSNGILVTPLSTTGGSSGSGSGSGSSIAGGLLSSASNGELMIHQYNDSSDFTISSTIVDLGTTSTTKIVKTGPGTLALKPTGDNTHTGGTVVTMGTVTLNGANRKVAGSGTLTIGPNGSVLALADNTFGLATSGSLTPVFVSGTLTTSGNNEINSITIAGGTISGASSPTDTGLNMKTLGTTAPTIKSVASEKTGEIYAKFTMNADQTIQCEKGTAPVDLAIPRLDLITGAYSIHKTGLGSLKIGSESSSAVAGWTGDMIVDEGKLIIDKGGENVEANATGRSLIINADGEAESIHALPWDNNGNGAIAINGGTLTLSSEASMPAITMNGGLIRGSSEMRTTGKGITVAASTSQAVISCPVNFAVNDTWTVAESTLPTELLVSGNLTGSGNFTKAGGGTVQLTGTIDYTGDTTIESGNLVIDNGKTTTLTTITGNGGLKVVGNSTLNLTSLEIDTLTIGSPEGASVAAVPEPSSMVLLILGAVAVLGYGIRRR